jgi:glycosyltransferase involved in cell wall biosynthesis
MRILFVNHTGASSGAEFALMRLVEYLNAEHSVAIACPPGGQLSELAEAAGVECVAAPAFEASLRPHPVQTPVGMARLVMAAAALARIARRHGAELIHANTSRAGLMAAGARAMGGPPFVVRAHESLPPSRMGRAVRFVLASSAAAVVTVSRETARRFNDGLERPVATHVYNSFDRHGFDPEHVRAAPIREELGIAPDAVLLGQVAQITPWKGQDTAIQALALLRADGIDAHLLLVGEIAFAGKTVRYDNHGYLRGLHVLVDELGLRDAVHFLGRRSDVPALLGALDLSLLPSWDEPFGNVTLESMAMGTPLLVTEVGGGPELLEDGVSGRLVPPKRPEAWAQTARELLSDRDALARMGRRARAATVAFSDEAHARQMLAVYERVLGDRSSAASADQTGEAAPWPG